MVMGCFNSITTNAGGIPYFVSTNTTVGTESVDIALGFSRRQLAPVGYLTVRISDAIPADATATLPVTLTLNGVTRSLTLFDGTPVTAAELLNGTGVITVFNNRFDGILQLISRTIV